MEFIDIVGEYRVLPVVENIKNENFLPLIGAICSGGLSTLCLGTWNDGLAPLFPAAGDFCVGVRVSDKNQALGACSAGAKFVCSYGLSENIFDVCSEYGVSYLPCCLTPYEISKAMEMGVNTIMLCPVEFFGGKSLCDRLISMFPRISFIAWDTSGSNKIDTYLQNPRLLAACSSDLASGSLDQIAAKCAAHVSRYSKNTI